MTTTRTELLTADDLLRLHSQGMRGELIRGVLCNTMSTGVEHGRIVMRLGRHLGNFVEPAGLGSLIGSDTGVVLERDPDTVREPDVGFISAERMPIDARVTSYSEVVPELIVEVVSPSDHLDDAFDKARMWLSFGARLVWVIDPNTRTVHVHRADHVREIIGEDGQLNGYDVLPGFTCEVSAILGR